MPILQPEEVQELIEKIIDKGEEQIDIETSPDTFPTAERIRYMAGAIRKQLEEAIDQTIFVTPLRERAVPEGNVNVISFNCCFPEANRNGVTENDLSWLSAQIDKYGAGLHTFEIENGDFNKSIYFDGVREYLELKMDEHYKSPMIVRMLPTEHECKKQAFVCFKEYGNFQRKNLGPLES